MSTPEAREKAQATRTANAKRSAVRKLVGRIHDLDLSPIDEEIAEMRRRMAELEGMREVVLKIRHGATQVGVPLIQRIGEYLAKVGVAKTPVIAADLNVNTIDEVRRALRTAGPEFQETIAGWRLADDEER